MEPIKEALTFDDVLLLPQFSSIVPANTNINVAKKIGSDVVLGLNNNIKLLNSRGKIINFKKKFNLYLALVYPNFGCSTSKIYKMVRTYNRPSFKNNRNPINSQAQILDDYFHK